MGWLLLRYCCGSGQSHAGKNPRGTMIAITRGSVAAVVALGLELALALKLGLDVAAGVAAGAGLYAGAPPPSHDVRPDQMVLVACG